MVPTRRSLLVALGGTAALAGCLGDDDDAVETDDGADGDDDPMGPEDDDDDDDEVPLEQQDVVFVKDHPELGELLAGPDEETLYMFEEDDQWSDTSNCEDDCTEEWPPLAFEHDLLPQGGDDVTGIPSVFERADGTFQVSMNGWPLYTYSGDADPTAANGHGVDDAWWAVDPSGDPVVEEEADVTISVTENAFEPDLAFIDAGDTVEWVLESGSHTVTMYHEDNDVPHRVPEDADMDLDFDFEEFDVVNHTFQQWGVFDFFCRPHEGEGMVGSIVVANADPDEPGLAAPQDELPEGARSALLDLEERVREEEGLEPREDADEPDGNGDPNGY